ncbi:hypothetical protein SNE40_019622 [Patella caerulea]|uniref:C2H2-type domain-containing protein n=1 Tax=Patella caerulea TaxID=87958 RepID=A0AAN8J7T3_PATCE
MLSGTGQYFPPEYLHSIPTSSPENQKSPLELLAQTCSSIGKETTPTKISLPALEKSNEKQRKSPPLDDKSVHGDEKLRESPKENGKPGFRSVSYTEMPPLVPILNHDDSSNSSTERKSSPLIIEHKEKTPVLEKKSSPVKPQSPPKENPSDVRKTSSSSPKIHHKPSVPSPTGAQRVPTPASVTAAHSAYLNGLKPTSNPLYSGFSGAHHLPYSAGLSLMGHGLSPEAAAVYQSQLLAHSGLHIPGFSAASAAAAAAQHSALKASAAAAASMNPYVSYTRVRTPSGATTLVPVCKDPYCTNCQLTVQTSHTSATCKTPGCSQCAHEKALLGLAASSPGMGLAGSPLSFYPQLSSLPSSATGLSSLHSPYHHPHSALSAHQGLPYVCNWVAGHDYCGKRFNSSEELMQHLRSHTSSIESGLPAGYGLGLPSGLSAASAGLAHLGGSAPISPNAIRRAYPTSLSPGLLGNGRFHPYKSPLGNVAAPPSGQQFPPLSAYYPPYSSLYGPRLGAAVP